MRRRSRTPRTTGRASLYFTKMGPQGLSITTGSGLCTIRLNAAETQAVVKFNYSGLTTWP